MKTINKWDALTLPNLISLARLLCAPTVAFLFVSGNPLAGIIVFILAAISDVLDGWLARTFFLETYVGKILDPTADRLLVLFGLITIGAKFLHPLLIAGYLVAEAWLGYRMLQFALAMRRAGVDPLIIPCVPGRARMATAVGTIIAFAFSDFERELVFLGQVLFAVTVICFAVAAANYIYRMRYELSKLQKEDVKDYP